jgi:hypothetical protein
MRWGACEYALNGKLICVEDKFMSNESDKARMYHADGDLFSSSCLLLLLLLARAAISPSSSTNDKMQRLLKTNNLFKPNQVSNLLIRFSLQNFQLIF